jgi:hypothetical protein
MLNTHYENKFRKLPKNDVSAYTCHNYVTLRDYVCDTGTE